MYCVRLLVTPAVCMPVFCNCEQCQWLPVSSVIDKYAILSTALDDWPQLADLGLITGFLQFDLLLQTLDGLHVDDTVGVGVALVPVNTTEQVSEPLVETHHVFLLWGRRVEQHPERVRVGVLWIIPAVYIIPPVYTCAPQLHGVR